MGLTAQDYIILTAVLGFLLALFRIVEKFGAGLLTRFKNNKTETDFGNELTPVRPFPEPSIEWMNTTKCLENRNEVLENVSTKTGKVHERLDEVKNTVVDIEKVVIRLEGKVETAIAQQQMLIQKKVSDWGQDHIRQYHRRTPSGG